MVRVRALHRWDVSPAEAVGIQRRLAALVVCEGAVRAPQLIAGIGGSAGVGAPGGRAALAAVVVVQWPGLEPVEQSVVRAEIRFPYMPGLLSFREIPVLLPALERLRSTPDLVLVDGQGIAHPRRLGLASHLGLLLDLPTIGCAKSRLVGTLAGPLGEERGATAPLVDAGEEVGRAVRTRTGAKPLYVSVGHRISLDCAVQWVLSLAPRYRIPEPVRLAHQAAAGARVAPESRTKD